MNKRGQVFILAALLLSFIIFSLVIRLNIVQREIIEGDFKGLSENYDIESPKFINLLAEKEFRGEVSNINDVAVLFLNFTQDFTKYSKTQNPEFGVIYFFDFGDKNSGKMLVGNYLDQEIIVWTDDVNDAEIIEGCSSKVFAGASFDEFKFNSGIQNFNFDCAKILNRPNNDKYDFNFIIGDIEYKSNILVGETKLGVVANEFQDRQRRVFINEFKEGKVVDFDSRCAVLKIGGSFVCKCEKRSERTCEDVLGRCVFENGECRER